MKILGGKYKGRSFFMPAGIRPAYLAGFLILIGIALRFSNYIYNRSLWTDEAWVANDVLFRTVKETLLNDISRVNLPAIPPVGFLLIEKLSVNVFGNNEYALRLFPFLCGILAVVLFWVLLKKLTGQITAVIGLSLFIFNGSLINYSAECKQYSGEMFVGIVLYLAALYFQKRTASAGRILIFALLGMIGMFISHTAVFVLGGIVIAQTVSLINDKECKTKTGYLLTYSLWGGCFILIYFAYLRVMIEQNNPLGQSLIHMHSMNFMPSGGFFSLDARKWLWAFILGIFGYPLILAHISLAMSMFILGSIGVFKSNKKTFFMLVLPMLLTIFASDLRKFPFYGRFVLFLVPVFLLFISQGISMIINRGKIGLVLGSAIFFVLIAQPIKDSFSQEIYPQGREEVRPLVGNLLKYQLPGDLLYMNNSSQYAYRYYLKFYLKNAHPALSPYNEGYFFDNTEQNRISLILNTNIVDPQGRVYLSTHVYRKNALFNKGEPKYKKRTWLLLTHLVDQATETFIKDCFDDRGKMLLAFKSPGASLYLYVLYEPLTQIQEI